MTVDFDATPLEIVLSFAELQRRLVLLFLAQEQPRDREFFADVSRRGTVDLDGESWQFVRHGAGVSFKSRNGVVDVHVGLSQFPDGVDGWRLWQYLESKGIPGLVSGSDLIASDDESGLENLLATLAASGHLVKTNFGRSLYVPCRAHL